METDIAPAVEDVQEESVEEDANTESEDVAEDTAPDVEPEPECEPVCEDKECGTDGCGGVCGECGEYQVCSNQGLCQPDPQAGCAGLSLAEEWKGTLRVSM